MANIQTGESTVLNIEVKGLYLNPSTFGDNAPNGALTKANNVVIDRPSIVETRRGFSNDFSTFVDEGVRSLYQYNNYLLANTTDNKLFADKLNNGTFTPYLVPNPDYPAYSSDPYILYNVPDPINPASRIRGLETNKNFYFITQAGTYRLDSINGEPRFAGAPPGLSGTGITDVTGSGFLPNNTRVAYRVVFGYQDANQQLILGAPSSRFIVTNTSGAYQNTIVTFQIPKEIVAAPQDFFFQVYRGSASPDLNTEPDDEMALVFEDLCTGGTVVITAGQITVNDITPDTLKGASLYTNQGQDGILQSNYRPPWALDVCTFKQYAFYANTRTLQNANLTLISAGALNGTDALVPGDTITFTPSELGGTPFTLTAVAGSNNVALGWFNVSNTGDPGYDIQVTASNIALVVNGYATNNFLTGYYTSTGSDLPGQMNFSRLTLVPDNFVITTSRIECFQQALPVTSTNDSRPNRIYYSKFNQPEAVPLVNYIEVGSANQPINRIVPLRDGVMVMKQDGVFRISNAAPPFTVTPIDYNVRILADNTAAELDNKVYFLSDQGVVALSDSDAQIMSFILDKTIIENTSPDLFPNLKGVAWGQAYQSDRKYILSMPQVSDDYQATQQYVYNHLTQVWTRWTRETSCGIVFKRDGKLYLGSRALDNVSPGSAPGINNNYLYQERKSFTNADYADNQYTATSTTNTYTKTLVILNPTLPNNIEVLPGWTVQQSSSGSTARIVSVNVGMVYTTLTMDQEQTWKLGDLIIYTPIYSEIETIQLDCDNPGMNKQFNEIVYIFSKQSFTQMSANLTSNTSGIPALDILIPTLRGGWGIDPWGPTPWGGNPSGQGKIRRYVPQAIQRAGWLYVNLSNAEAFTSFGWSGLQLYFKNTSTRQK